MKQKQNPSNLQSSYLPSHQISFKQTIQKIQLSALKSTLQKKKIASIRNRLKEQWLDRTKIIPPHISPIKRQNLFRATDSFPDTHSFKHSKHHCYKKELVFDDDDHLFQTTTIELAVSADEITRKQLAECKSHAGSSTGFQKCRIGQLKQRKFKENWKHSYRKDQINLLRYSIASPPSEKSQKTDQVTRMLYTMIQGEPKQRFELQGTKMIICVKRPWNQEENKQNMEWREETKRQEKKHMFYVKKSKTSLAGKKPTSQQSEVDCEKRRK